MSKTTKARFKPPRKVIGFRSPFQPRAELATTRIPARTQLPRQPRALSRQLFHVGKWGIDHANAGFAGVFDEPVEPAIDKENAALTRLAIAAVGFARAEAQAGDIAQPPADDALDRLRHPGVMDARRIVQIALHERQHF